MEETTPITADNPIHSGCAHPVSPWGGGAACGAKTRDGSPCPNPVVTIAAGGTGNRCRMHGGKSLTGLACPAFGTGRYSKYMPQAILQKVQEAQNDPELLSIRAEVEVAQARVAMLIERLDSGETSKTWRDIQATWKKFKEAIRAKDDDAIFTIGREMDKLVLQGAEEEQRWEELMTTMERRARLAKAEEKKLLEKRAYLSNEQAVMFAVMVMDEALKFVSDTKERRQLTTNVTNLMRAMRPVQSTSAIEENTTDGTP